MTRSRSVPLLISHRGAHADVPENTILAFLKAIDLGAHAIELDVHATNDGVVVVHHDAALYAGDVPRERARAIADLSSSDVSRHTLPGGVQIPTLEEVLGAVGNATMVYVEIKATGIEPLVVKVIRQSSARCAVHSFDHRIVRDVKLLFPAIRTGVLDVARHIDPVAALRATGASDLWQHVDYIDQELVASVHAIGAGVVAWTANDPAQWSRLRAMGVDAICTDRVAELAAALA